MAYLKIECSVARNKKFVKAGPAPSWLWVCGLAYCQEGLTDGFIPAEALPYLGVKNVAQLAAHLVKAGLWDVAPGGWTVHDYLEHNRSAADVDEIREKRAAGGKLGGRPTPFKHLPPTCGVYFIQQGSDLVKIGAAANIRQRISNLQCGAGESVTYLGRVECHDIMAAKGVERDLHKRFAGSRHRGEWFYLDENLARFIRETLAETFPVAVDASVVDVVPSQKKDESPRFDGQAAFMRLCAEYPKHRKATGQPVQVAFLKALGEDAGQWSATFDQMLANLANHVASHEWRTRQQYIPGLDRWLTEGLWQRELSADAPPTDAKASTVPAWAQKAKAVNQ